MGKINVEQSFDAVAASNLASNDYKATYVSMLREQYLHSASNVSVFAMSEIISTRPNFHKNPPRHRQ